MHPITDGAVLVKVTALVRMAFLSHLREDVTQA